MKKDQIFKNNKNILHNKWLTIVLIVLVVGSLGYIIYNSVKTNLDQKNVQYYNSGANAGYQQAVIDLVQQAVTCQLVPITFQNQTINMIAYDCLTQQQPTE